MVVWHSFEEKQPLDGGGAWTATFLSHDVKKEFAAYRMAVYDERDTLAIECVIRAGASWIKFADIDSFERQRINLAYHAAAFLRPAERFASHTVVIGGVAYRWALEEDEFDYMSMSKRGLSGDDVITITGENGFSLKFPPPSARPDRPGWWRDAPTVNGLGIVRVIELGTTNVEEAQRVAASSPARTLQNELDDASTALATADADLFIRAMLALGCSGYVADAEAARAIDDWIASHADALPPEVHRILSLRDKMDYRRVNSALAFLAELCTRVNVELGITIAPPDEKVRSRPWGVPPSHSWWR